MSTVPESGGLRVVARFILLSFLFFQATTASLADTRGTGDDVSRANGGYIESMVWLDTNRDAIRDKNEIGLAGVSVSLLDCDGNFLRAQNTDQSGRFHFGRLAAGCYRLRYASMDGYRYCPANVGEDVGRDSDADPSTGLTKAIDLRVNQALTALDAGVVALTEPQIGDRVWEDMNANGVQDVGEPGLAKVAVALFDCSGGQVLGTDGNQRVAMTDQDGYFVFEDLASACYQVRIDTPASYRFSEPDMTSELLDSDADPLSGMAHAGNVSAGQGLFNIDAGMYRTGTIGDWVWVDADNDNIQSLTESGLEGVQVMLLDADGVPQGRTVNTDIDGYYEFSNVVPGAYRLQFALPSGYFFGEPNVSSHPQLDSNANGLGVTRVFQLPSGGQRVDIDVAARGGGIPSLDVEKLTN
ncbi:MAG: SdrD B-like domain-containing protein, partial [Gammaproteobacteria bacterium]